MGALHPGAMIAVSGALDIQLYTETATGLRKDFPKIKADRFEVREEL